MARNRRELLASALALGAGAALPATAFAQRYPERPIRMITPNSAGSGVDYVARKVALYLERAAGKPVVVENMPGAGGIIGTQALIQAAPDGYTLAVVATNHIIIPHMNSSVRYDAVKQVTPICMLLEGCSVLAARPGFPARTAGELIDYARQNPGKVNFGSTGVGTMDDLRGRLLQQMGKINVLNVPYKGVSTMLPDLMAGVIDVALFGVSSVAKQIEAKQLIGLGLTRDTTVPALPGVPPISDSVPGFDLIGWYALIGPANLDKAVVAQLERHVQAIQASKAYVEDAATFGGTPRFAGSAEMTAIMGRDSERFGQLIRAAGLKPA